MRFTIFGPLSSLVSRLSLRNFLLRRIAAFFTLIIVTFMMGCFSKGDPSSPTSPQVGDYQIESEIKSAWSGLYQDPAWKEAWKKTDTAKLKELQDLVTFTMLDVKKSFKDIISFDKKLRSNQYSSSAELRAELEPALDKLIADVTLMSESFSQYNKIMKESGLGDIIALKYPTLMENFSHKSHPMKKQAMSFMTNRLGLTEKESYGYFDMKSHSQELLKGYWSIIEKNQTQLDQFKETFVKGKGLLISEIDRYYNQKLILEAVVAKPDDVNREIRSQTRSIDFDASTAVSILEAVNGSNGFLNTTFLGLELLGTSTVFPYVGIAVGGLTVVGGIVAMCYGAEGIGVALMAVGIMQMIPGLNLIVGIAGLLNTTFWLLEAFTFTHYDLYYMPNMDFSDPVSDGSGDNVGGNIYVGGGGIDNSDMEDYDTQGVPKEFPLNFNQRILTGQLSSNGVDLFFVFEGDRLPVTGAVRHNLINYVRSRYFTEKNLTDNYILQYLNNNWLKARVDLSVYASQVSTGKDSYFGISAVEELYIRKPPVAYLDAREVAGKNEQFIQVANHEAGITYEALVYRDRALTQHVGTKSFTGPEIRVEALGLEDNLTYFVGVRTAAAGRYMPSRMSNVISLVRDIPDAPPVSGITAGITGSELQINWDAVPGEKEGYNVYLVEFNDPFLFMLNKNKHRLNGRLLNTNQYQAFIPSDFSYRGKSVYAAVTTLNKYGQESQPRFVSLQIPFAPLQVPGNLRAFNVKPASFMLVWDKPAGANRNLSYDVYLSGVKKLSGLSESLASLSGLASGTSYTVGVTARDETGHTSQTEMTVITGAYGENFGLQASGISDTALTLYWNEPTGGLPQGGYYRVYQNGEEIQNTIYLNYLKAQGLNEGTDYTFEVRAYRGDDSFITSVSAILRTLYKKPRVSALQVTEMEGKALKISWAAPAEPGVTGYVLYGSESWPLALSEANKLGQTASSEFTTGPKPGNIRHYFAVVPIRNALPGEAVTTFALTSNTAPVFTSEISAEHESDPGLDFSPVKLSFLGNAVDSDPLDSPIGGGHVRGYKIAITPSDAVKGQNPLFVYQPASPAVLEKVAEFLRGNRNFTFQVYAVDNLDHPSAIRQASKTTINNAPYQPIIDGDRLSKERYKQDVTLRWTQQKSPAWDTPDSDGEITHYTLYLNGQKVQDVPFNGALEYSYIFKNQTPGMKMDIGLEAVDNHGAFSQRVGIITSPYITHVDFEGEAVNYPYEEKKVSSKFSSSSACWIEGDPNYDSSFKIANPQFTSRNNFLEWTREGYARIGNSKGCCDVSAGLYSCDKTILRVSREWHNRISILPAPINGLPNSIKLSFHYQADVIKTPNKKGSFKLSLQVGDKIESIMSEQSLTKTKEKLEHFVPQIYHKDKPGIFYKSSKEILTEGNTSFPEDWKNKISKEDFFNNFIKGACYTSIYRPELNSFNNDFVSWLFGNSHYEWDIDPNNPYSVCNGVKTLPVVDCSEESGECRWIASTKKSCKKDGKSYEEFISTPMGTYTNPEFTTCLNSGGTLIEDHSYATLPYLPEKIAVNYDVIEQREVISNVSYQTLPEKPVELIISFDGSYVNQVVSIIEWWYMNLENCDAKEGKIQLKISDIRLEYLY